MATVDQTAQAAYEAYVTAVGGVAFNGDRLPTWDEQRQRNPRITDAWRAAAQAAVTRSLGVELAPDGERAFAPHCDQRILHAPGECWSCDLYPDWQALREKWHIAFTGQPPLTGVAMKQLPCPADYARPPGSKSDHTRWGPNQAQGDRP